MNRSFNICALLVLTGTARLIGQAPIPDVELDVTVQWRVEGKMEDPFRLLQLACKKGHCSLATVTLGQCLKIQGLVLSYPSIEQASTADGTLQVSTSGNALVVKETIRPDAAGQSSPGTYRFEFAPVKPGEAITKLTGFSGAYTKMSEAAKKVITIEIIPVKTQIVTLGCGVLMQGIDN